MIKMLLTIVFSILFLSGCTEGNNQKHGMPAEMPEDFNFSVSFGYGEVNKNEINTYTHKVTKDLITKGTAAADLTFSKDELQSIYDKMREINMMESKDFSGKEGCDKTPSNTDSWKVTVNGETKSFSWTDEHCTVSDEAEQLLELRTYLQHLVEGKDAYKALPATEGGYD